MSKAVLNVEKREVVDKKENKALRRDGRVPAVYYIRGEDSVSLSVDEKELKMFIHSDANIVDLSLGGKDSLKCVIRDVQWHPVSGTALHVDFMGIKMTEKVTVAIPVYVVGTSVGVKTGGGVMYQLLREINVECLPGDIPEHLEVDVTDLEVGDSFLVGSLKLEKVNVLNDDDQSIVIVRMPSVAAEPEVEDVEEPTEPELVGEEKEESEDGE